MDLVLHEGAPSAELLYKVEIVGGKIVLSAGYAGKGGNAEFKAVVDPDYFIDKLAEAIPGKVDDTVLNLLKAALKM